jgi:hypothetical protein
MCRKAAMVKNGFNNRRVVWNENKKSYGQLGLQKTCNKYKKQGKMPEEKE